MKQCTVDETRIEDYFDERLSRDDALAVDRHLHECDPCRRHVESLSVIRQLASEFPRTLEPDRDLWPAIVARLSAPALIGGPGLFRPRSLIRWIISAAAILLISLSAVLFHQRSPRFGAGSPNLARDNSVRNLEMDAEIVKAEQAYLDATQSLIAELDSERVFLEPGERTVLDGNLAITDRAISELKLALKDRPSDFALARKLLATYEQRIGLLQQATQLSFAARIGG